MDKFDFPALFAQAQELIQTGKVSSLRQLSDVLKVSRSTMTDGFRRHFGVDTFEGIKNKGLDFSGKVLDPAKNVDEVEIDGNFARVRAVRVEGQITTIPELLKLAKIDPNEWDVVNPEIKKWDVVLKLNRGKDAPDIVEVVPSIYLDVPLKARHPKALEPIIHPVELNIPKLPNVKKLLKDQVGRALIINDAQVGFRRTLHTTNLVPFHDRRVLDLALQIAQEEQIDHISFGGDCLDLSEWSNKFLPEPEFYWTTQPAIIELSWWLAQMRLARPQAEMKKLEGNHDKRLANMIMAMLKQAYKLRAVDELKLPPSMSVERLLALHSLNIEYVGNYPDNGYWLNDNVKITHGDVVRSNPGDTAKAVANKQIFTTVFGHIHRRELVARRQLTRDGVNINTAFCPGCACHIDGRVPGSKSDAQWQQGIAVIEYTKNDEHIIPIAINDGTMIYNGKVWKARNRDTEMNKYLSDKLESIPI